MNAFLSIYAVANRMGLLRHSAGQRLFSKAYFAYKRHLEDPFTTLIDRHPSLFKGGHILDVGANIGYTAAIFAGVISPAFNVYAFEPEERNFEMLQTSIHVRGLASKVIAVRAAVGDQKGNAELWLNPKHHADHRIVTNSFQGEKGSSKDTQRVPVVSLDDFCSEHLGMESIGFIKIDVQGYEECVCRGMSGALSKNPLANVCLEYYPEGIESLGFKPLAILELFRERGYAVYSLTRQRGLRSVSYEEISTATQASNYIDLLFSKSGTILDGTSACK